MAPVLDLHKTKMERQNAATFYITVLHQQLMNIRSTGRDSYDIPSCMNEPGDWKCRFCQ